MSTSAPHQLSVARMTENQNSTAPNDDAYLRLQELLDHARTLTLVLSITMVVALVGNLFLASLIIKMSRRRMGPVQILILHTCVADICFALCTALPQMASTLTFPYFYGGDFLCRLVKYLQLIPMFASPFLLVAISADRYVAICKPLLALKWKYRLVHTLAAIAWVASLLFSTPNILAFRYDLVDNTGITACMFQMDEAFEKAWIGIFSLTAWLVPSIAVGVLYTFVCLAVWRSMRRDGKDIRSPPSPHLCDDALGGQENGGLRRESCAADYDYSINTTPLTMRKNFTPSINSYKVKTVKLTLTIVVANFVLWAPFCISNVISTYFRDIEIDVMVTTCIMLVGNANSCVNPWIYIIFNYKRVWEVLCGGGDQRHYSNYRNQAATSAASSRAQTPVIRRQPPAENNDHDNPMLSPKTYYIRKRPQNSHRCAHSRLSNHSGAMERKHSQTSTISAYSAV